jgi:hypothetical protein
MHLSTIYLQCNFFICYVMSACLETTPLFYDRLSWNRFLCVLICVFCFDTFAIVRAELFFANKSNSTYQIKASGSSRKELLTVSLQPDTRLTASLIIIRVAVSRKKFN